MVIEKCIFLLAMTNCLFFIDIILTHAVLGNNLSLFLHSLTLKGKTGRYDQYMGFFL